MICTLLEKPLLCKTNSSPYVLFVPSCVIWATMKNPIFLGGAILCWRSLTGNLSQQLIRYCHSEVRENMPRLSWFELASLCGVWSPFLVCAYICVRPHSPFLLHMDQYSWHVLPLCRINSSGGKKQPLTASVHTAFLRHCMKIDGFDIISKASLSHMPAVEGTGWDQLPPSILAFAMIQGVCFHLCIHLLFYFNSLNKSIFFHYNVIHACDPRVCTGSDPERQSSKLHLYVQEESNCTGNNRSYKKGNGVRK